MALRRVRDGFGRIQHTVLIAIILSVITVGAASVTATQTATHPGGVVVVKPAQLKWQDYPGRPGVKLAVIEGDLAKAGPFLMRVKFPAGFKLAPHTHPSAERTTIMSGGMLLGYGTNPAGPAEMMTPGTVIITPANTPHFATMPTETIVQTYGVGPWSSNPVK